MHVCIYIYICCICTCIDMVYIHICHICAHKKGHIHTQPSRHTKMPHRMYMYVYI